MLMVASMGSMLAQFNIENMKILIELGYKVDVAANFTDVDPMSHERRKKLFDFFKEENIKYFQIDFSRGIGSVSGNLKAYSQLNKVIMNNKYDFIHTHSPLASVITRISAKKNNVPVLYTAHGFQFFRGGSFKDWVIFYPIEYFFSKYTDGIITINNEDFKRAKKMNSKKVYYIPGVGVNTRKYGMTSENGKFNKIRIEFSLGMDTTILLSVGELSKRKNHEVIIRAMATMKELDIVYFICGVGQEETKLRELVQTLNLNEKVKLLGYRTDIDEVMSYSDIFVFPSKREGLGLAAIEAMAAGLPIITSNVNGINDYSIDGVTGYSYSPNDYKGFAKGIKMLINNKEIFGKMKINNKNAAVKYDIANVNKNMKEIYEQYTKEK
ncbi:glycosyltransferase [Dellaglioa algida]|uniref:glycosyltransferase n=1 Tax=Dellaglioa algida TaxID=105612 RepID=UPI001CDBF0B8|nr:glycosyltransferase [Dellaglioa algida]MDK1718410.1 glycosyltransferase [Dellaglioa algida]MDK1728195.1 glycosyltransferase [Dellaglioa algida]MDK1729498.1 glycosyltransferase [Dellaglioa algida]MDK1736550.1 glycosyltransferase [Dellaglioa algida]MDK1737526.1 glycosyltransferase [Dellaglioa algida]